jgi:hypothetical protein
VDKLVLRSESGVEATFHSREYEPDGWLRLFSVDLIAANFHAATTVENPGYGHPPSQLFGELASSWRGWQGVKTWLSLEGELEIQATSDSTGHVTLLFKVPAYAAGGLSWSAQCSVVVEAGQLERVAQESHEFFRKRVA